MIKKLGYIDHSFHKKTESTDFLRDILREHFDVIDIWDESWNGGASPSVEYINSQNFDHVLFFQSLLPIRELKKIKAKIIWVPMYDGVIGRGKSFWMELSTIKIKIISFSNALSVKLKENSLDVINVKYFPNPNNFKKVLDFSGKKIFFWQRTKLSVLNVKKIIGKQKIDQLILKLDPDPGHKPIFPSEYDIKKYNIKIIQGFLSKGEYMKMLSGSNIFVSPRKFEGIGMSFIEAMAMGLAVIAFDNPTMNEYITHNKNGYLFHSRWKRKIDLSNFEEVGENAREYCEDGFKDWENDKSKIIEFINSKYKPAIKLDFIEFLYVKILGAVYDFIKNA